MKSSSTSATKVIRVLIADDHPVVREGLVTILKSEKDIEVVGEAADGKETCELYHELAPNVLLLDLRMPEKDGLQVITDLMSHGEPKPRITRKPNTLSGPIDQLSVASMFKCYTALDASHPLTVRTCTRAAGYQSSLQTLSVLSTKLLYHASRSFWHSTFALRCLRSCKSLPREEQKG